MKRALIVAAMVLWIGTVILPLTGCDPYEMPPPPMCIPESGMCGEQ